MSIDDHKLLKFPCTFPVKAIGHSKVELHTIVFDLIKKHIPGLKQDAITSKPSKKGKYTALTITFEASSLKQVDAVYLALTSCEHIVWVM